VSDDLNRQRTLNFLKAFYSGAVEDALSYVSEDVDFVANAPIDIFPHMGHRRGKAQVREMWDAIHKRYSSMSYEIPIIVAQRLPGPDCWGPRGIGLRPREGNRNKGDGQGDDATAQGQNPLKQWRDRNNRAPPDEGLGQIKF
jgi:hypothetical protein